MATKSLNEKWSSMVQLANEKGENGTGGSSIITEILLVNVLTDPVLYERILTSALYHDDPVFPQTITLFHNYVLIHQMFSRLAIPHLPVQIVTVEEPPIPFSPFSLADCTMLNHFSFNDFIAIAFPDIARDLDAQI